MYADNMYYRTGANKFRDTTRKNFVVNRDTTLTEVLDAFAKRQQSEILETALNNLKGTLQSLRSKKTEFQIKSKRLNKHEIALHEEFAPRGVFRQVRGVELALDPVDLAHAFREIGPEAKALRQ